MTNPITDPPKKEISYDEDALKELTSGVREIAQAVTSTLGPGGRPVILGQGEDRPAGPLVTKDGVTVAEELGSGKAQFEGNGETIGKN